ncbi:hypothetical protein X797_003584 [Metarhizium robertsii]|uniref:Uncharacterized protein n=1 Tax=Metarhizium robertsii TaxID=568076 RepID=A0A0A1V1Q2_9HYPO|nr:hypothetical protein X797_003584 [Metarhizium robertsii]
MARWTERAGVQIAPRRTGSARRARSISSPSVCAIVVAGRTELARLGRSAGRPWKAQEKACIQLYRHHDASKQTEVPAKSAVLYSICDSTPQPTNSEGASKNSDGAPPAKHPPPNSPTCRADINSSNKLRVPFQSYIHVASRGTRERIQTQLAETARLLIENGPIGYEHTQTGSRFAPGPDVCVSFCYPNYISPSL